MNRSLFWFRVSGIKEAQDKIVRKKLLCSHTLTACARMYGASIVHNYTRYKVTRRHILPHKYQQI
jgi:hypothetical protein